MGKSKRNKRVNAAVAAQGLMTMMAELTSEEGKSENGGSDSDDLFLEVATTRTKVKDAIDSMNELLLALDRRLALLEVKQRQIRAAELAMKSNSEKADSIIRLNVRGRVFETYKETLVKVPGTYFYAMLSSGVWLPNPDGTYFIDRNYEGFERILAFLSTGVMCYDGLSDYEIECVEDNLDYFQIFVPQPEINYSSATPLPFKSSQMCELADSRIVGAGDDPNLYLKNLSDGAIIKTFEGHEEVVQCAIELVDGRICTASDDCTIKIWDLLSGICEKTFEGHAHVVKSVIQLDDGRLCSCSYDYTIKVWNLGTGVCETTLTGHMEYILAVVQLKDGRLASASSDYTVKIWNLNSSKCERTCEGHSDSATSVAELGNGKICSGSYDSTIKIWNSSSGKLEMTLVGHTQSVNCLLVLDDGRVCSGSDDATIKLWNSLTGECVKTLRAHTLAVYRVIQLSDGKLLSSDEDDCLILWSS